jgi:trimethylamine:corrinoid methyltransferase-like protein
LSEINKVGPGKSFLSQPSTLKNYKTGYYVSRVYPRYSMEKWQEAGQPPARQVLRERTQDLLSSLPVPEDYGELMGRGEEFIRQQSA